MPLDDLAGFDVIREGVELKTAATTQRIKAIASWDEAIQKMWSLPAPRLIVVDMLRPQGAIFECVGGTGILLEKTTKTGSLFFRYSEDKPMRMPFISAIQWHTTTT